MLLNLLRWIGLRLGSEGGVGVRYSSTAKPSRLESGKWCAVVLLRRAYSLSKLQADLPGSVVTLRSQAGDEWLGMIYGVVLTDSGAEPW